MGKLNHYGKLRLRYLQKNRPEFLTVMEENGRLSRHLLQAQRFAAWEFERLLFSGMDEKAAEEYVLSEYVCC